MRLLLAQHAETSIDLQYYPIKSDKTGLALVNELLNVAEQGVEILGVLNDVFTSGYDASLGASTTTPT